MKNLIRSFFIYSLFVTAPSVLVSQNVGINATGAAPDASAGLDVNYTNKGLLVPRVLLTAINSNAPIGAGIATSLLVYNTAAAGTGTNAVTPGYYYWDGSKWLMLYTVSSTVGQDWNTMGNIGTVDGTHFIGTTDNVPFNIRVNNEKAGRIESRVSGSTFFGYQSGNVNTSPANLGIGYRALANNTTADNNTALGHSALSANSTGCCNTASGSWALWGNSVGGGNTVSGTSAMFFNTTGGYNVASGYNVFLNNTTGSYNTVLGALSGSTLTIGTLNTILGYSANVSANNLNNATVIGANAIVDASNKVRIGNNNVTATDIAGQVRVNSNTIGTNDYVLPANRETNGQVLVTNGAGVTTWTTASIGQDWSILGNAGTVDGTNFIGTTDNVPFNIRVNNQKAGRIESGGTSGTFFGYQSGNVNTGTENVGVGYRALYSNTTGDQNTASGSESLYRNTTGGYNTASGYSALFNNTTGGSNTATGANTLYSNTTGICNTASGSSALYSNITGSNNTASGFWALRNNASGYNNTASGTFALYSNTTGTNNTASGNNALYTNNTGNYNTAFGSNALYTTNIGSSNTASGAYALFKNASGDFNTTSGFNALYNNTTGSNNAAFGSYALGNVTTGSNNTMLGYYADVSANNLNNATAIGANALAGASNVVILGSITGTNGATASASVGIGTTAPAELLEVNGFVRSAGYRTRNGTGGAAGVNIFNYFWTGTQLQAWIDGVNLGVVTITSDRRLKEKIEPMQASALSRVMNLKPVNYYYKNIPGTPFTGSSSQQEGFIADELQAVIPSAVNGTKDELTSEGTIQPQTVNVLPVVSLLTKAIQELNTENTSLKNEMEQMKKELAELKLLLKK